MRNLIFDEGSKNFLREVFCIEKDRDFDIIIKGREKLLKELNLNEMIEVFESIGEKNE